MLTAASIADDPSGTSNKASTSASWANGQDRRVASPFLDRYSSAIAHLAGVKDSENIVAINQDEEAPIFSIADHRLKAGIFEAIPELVAKL